MEAKWLNKQKLKTFSLVNKESISIRLPQVKFSLWAHLDIGPKLLGLPIYGPFHQKSTVIKSNTVVPAYSSQRLIRFDA